MFVFQVTIPCDKFRGCPKGFAYIEFALEASAIQALDYDGREFKGRILRVTIFFCASDPDGLASTRVPFLKCSLSPGDPLPNTSWRYFNTFR